ncbi:MAG TPA: hypothetical protein VKK31_11520 [Thermoanaerobaculia bacterium]|nr:hypothetical protein [Thermoanaerobaculia bacterium]
MNETTTQMGFDPAGPADKGLRSGPGIRWLLLAGALVTGVSIYRLVQTQWAAMPAPLQFLILTAGALAIFALGTVTRERLRLPHAGAAMLFLFTGLLPVLAWGAVYLELLGTPGGWLAFGAGGAALLGAAVHALRSIFRYSGKVYPAALGILLAAQPLVPWLGQRWPGPAEALYGLTAVVLGLVLHFGSRDVNRFFFHRDRRDGADRPVHLVPFLLLGVLYAGVLSLLDLRSAFLALPLAVLGIVLAGTGEEYYRAVTESLGRAPQRWPGRSVALLALGFSFTAAAVPLARLDPTGRCLPLVALCAAGLFLRWSLRYGHEAIHALGISAAFVAWHSIPVLAPGLPHAGWDDAGFLAGLTVLGALLARRQAPEGLRRTHGALIALHLLGMTVLSFVDSTHPAPLLAAALGITLLGLPAVRRIEPIAIAPFTLAALVFTGVQTLSGTLPALTVTGAAILALALASRFLEPVLSRLTGVDAETARQAVLLPVLGVASLIALQAIDRVFGESSPLAGIDGMLAGAVWMVAGYRLRRPPAVVAGGLMLSLGSHAALLLEMGSVTSWLPLLTQTFFVLFWLAARQSREQGRISPFVHGAARTLAVLHGLGAFVWLACTSPVGSRGTIEPLILLLAGLALLWDGLTDRQRDRHEGIDLGLALLVAWAPVQLLFASGNRPWSSLLITCLTLTGLELGLLAYAARRSAGHWLARRCGLATDDWDVLTALSLRGLVRVWLILAAAACLLFAGPEALVLALTMTGVLFLARVGIEGWAPHLAFPARLTLLPLLQLAILAAAGGHPARDLPVAILDQNLLLLPWIALCALAWRGLIEALGRRQSLAGWSLVLEALTLSGYLVAFVTRFELATWADAAMIAVAAGWAAAAFLDGRRTRDAGHGWWLQAWAGLAVLHAFTAGWLYFGSGLAPYVLLAVGVVQYVLGAFLTRTELGSIFSPSCRQMGLALPVVAGALSLLRIPGAGTVWLPALATFLVSLFYTVVASRETRPVFPSLAAAAFLSLALVKVIAVTQLGMELYFLAPGLALLSLAWLLRTELGPVWSRHVTAAGASCIYATPIVALSGEISWGWLAALLVATVAFGAASFVLRSRSLLTVSTAALLTDLGFFVFRIGTTAPMALWVLGLAFGLALMAAAAWLEYQREGVLQQIRIFGRELQAWS